MEGVTLERREGREIWHVTTDGNIKTIITPSSSIAVMDETVIRYDKALKRLARR
ncbi:hypothetical protein LCGC14_2264100 [marine sediment metagenome]|uniref:Uncharacterized protein n=1 Tax=marine sediment metagenome TaxID=412755 RepID=A0A0F9FB92_9ZZZZ